MRTRYPEERVLIVAPVGQDGAAMAAMLARNGLLPELCAHVSEAAQKIPEGSGALLLTEEALEDTASAQLFQILEDQPAWSQLPLIILTKGGETRQVRLLKLLGAVAGSVTLLERPMDPATLLSSAEVALRSRRRQYQVRDLIADRERNERALREQARLLDLSRDAIIVVDREERITYWNEGATEVYGWTREQALGQSRQTLLKTELPESPEQIMEKLERDGRWNGELVRTCADGHRLTVASRWVLDRDSEGRAASLLETSNDITQRKEMENALRDATETASNVAAELERLVGERTAELTATNEQLESFVYTVAHDLRAPLRAMEGFSQMLVEEAGAGLSPAARDYSLRINRAAQFMDALLRDLLTFSRVSQERVELSPISLERVVQATLSRLEPEIQARKARIESVPPWPAVQAHEATLGQVFANLISNAIKFVPAGVQPLVRLSAEERADPPVVRVWVEDNGIGISPEYQHQIFRVFTRLAGDKYPGTGIGLAIVQKGVERMRGRLGLESTVGVGTRFWFDLSKAPDAT